MAVHRCKFCKQDWPTYRELRHHCEDEHSTEFLQVAQWLGNTVQPRLEQFEKLANEGLSGNRESNTGS